MRFSIQLRTIVALNAFVIGLAVVLGWIAQDVAGDVVEERLVREMVTSASGFLRDKSFPRNNTMMVYLRELFDAEWVATESGVDHIVGSSLPDAQTQEFRQRMGGLEAGTRFDLDKQPYRVGWADFETDDRQTNKPVHGRLYMLVPETQFREARAHARAEVIRVTVAAAAAATLLAVLLSISVTRPIRRLAQDMDHLAQHDGSVEAHGSRAALRGPTEITRLASSFYRLLDRLGLARRQMAQSEQLATLGTMALSVAHELRNPLSGIQMNVRVLKDHPELRDDPGLEAILREIERMGLYLDELMGLSPAGDGTGRALSRSLTTLSELANSVLTILAGRCRHTKVVVEKDFCAPEPTVSVDAIQIRQAMMNLMVNAIEAMPSGGTMRLGIERRDAHLRFSIADTGKGIEADGRDIFEAFVSGKPNGVGLGLYICKQIIERHGGRIGYDGAVDGTTFWFELPLPEAGSSNSGGEHTS